MKPPEPPCLKASVDPLQMWGGGSVRLGIARIEGTGTEERREGAEARNARNERVGRRRGGNVRDDGGREGGREGGRRETLQVRARG